MGRPVYGVENFYSTRQFPNHTITANEAASGREAFRVGSGRRRPALNSWAPTTANAAANIKVACDRPRGATYSAIDGHNLRGKTVRLQVSGQSDFATNTEAWSAVIPSNVYPSSLLSEGLITEDGTYLRTFDLHVGKYWRYVIDAMGDGLKTQVAGLYLGLHFSPAHQVIKPFSFGDSELLQRSDPSPVVEQRRGSVHLQFAGDLEYEQARYHFDGLLFRGRPMWLVYDDEEAEKSHLVKRVAGTTGIQIEGDWSEFQVRFDWLESEPEVRA